MTAYPSRVHMISTLCYVGNYLMFWLYFYFSSSRRLHINVRKSKEQKKKLTHDKGFNSTKCEIFVVSLLLLSPCFPVVQKMAEKRFSKTGRLTERQKESVRQRERERKNVCVGARVQYKVSWGLFSWLSRSVSPPSTSPVTHARTHTHTAHFSSNHATYRRR